MKQLRAISLWCIFISVPLTFIILLNDRTYFWITAIFGYLSIFVFTATEAFGPFARQRSMVNRVIARLVLALYAAIVLSIPIFAIVSSFQWSGLHLTTQSRWPPWSICFQVSHPVRRHLILVVRPMNQKVVLDQEVIKAWAIQVAAFKSGNGRLQKILLLSMLSAFVLLFFFPHILLVLLIFGLGLGFIVTVFAGKALLHCPNCKKSPISLMDKGTAENSDFCEHCFYWLKSPHS